MCKSVPCVCNCNFKNKIAYDIWQNIDFHLLFIFLNSEEDYEEEMHWNETQYMVFSKTEVHFCIKHK